MTHPRFPDPTPLRFGDYALPLATLLVIVAVCIGVWL